MRKNRTSESGLFNPRVLAGFFLCSVGVVLGMFSLAAIPLSELETSASRKPAETPRAQRSVPPDAANFLSTFGSNANRLPAGVPLPPSGLDAPPGRKPGAQFSVNGQSNPSSSNPTAGFPGVAGMPLQPGTASGANLLANPGVAKQQAAPPSVPQPFASGSMLLAPEAASGWSIVNSPNSRPTPTDNFPSGVTCVSASDCWAVGYYDNVSAYQSLIEH